MHDLSLSLSLYIYIYIMGTFNTFIHNTFLIVSGIVLNISCCHGCHPSGINKNFL
jgi:hypothetical protein